MVLAVGGVCTSLQASLRVLWAGVTHKSKEPFSCVDLIPELLFERSTELMLSLCISMYALYVHEFA